MTADVAELERVLASSPSPFSDAVLPNAYRDTPDVPEIHGDVRERIERLIGAAGERSAATTLQVVNGDAGEGKTHILAWLRRTAESRWLTRGARPFALVPIPPLRSIDRPYYHILGEAVRALRRPLPGPLPAEQALGSPLERILSLSLFAVVRELADSAAAGEPLAAFLRSLGDERFSAFPTALAAEAERLWPEIEPALVAAAERLPSLADVDRDILRALVHFPRAPLRGDLLDWLGGASLPQDRLDALGARLALDTEDGAGRALGCLFALGRLAGVPIVLAFDQIEGTQRLGDEAVASFLGALAELFNISGSAVLLVFCQTVLWPRLKKLAPQHAQHRLESERPCILRSLTPEQGAALYQCRMSHFWRGHGATPPDPWYPLTRDQVLGYTRTLETPRRVLQLFQSLAFAGATPPPPPKPADIVRAKYRTLLDDEKGAQPRTPEARAELAGNVVREVLAAAVQGQTEIDGTRVESIAEKPAARGQRPGTQVVFRRGPMVRSLYVEANSSMHGQSVAAAAKRLRDALAGGDDRRAALVRESGLPLPPAARQILSEVTPRGAVIWLQREEVAPMAAIEGLLNAAAAGDIPVTEVEARRIVCDEIGSSLPTVQALVERAFADGPPPTAKVVDDEAIRRVRAHLVGACAIESLPRLVQRLGLPEERVQAAVQSLRDLGVVDVVFDRSRVATVVLRPDELVTSVAAQG